MGKWKEQKRNFHIQAKCIERDEGSMDTLYCPMYLGVSQIQTSRHDKDLCLIQLIRNT